MQGRDSGLVLGAIVFVVLVFGLLGGGMMMGPGMMGGSWGIGAAPWLGIVMMIIWVLVVGGGVLLLVSLLRRDRSLEAGLSTGQGSRDPQDILRERYARGEITREQFDQMRKDLE